MARLAKKDSNRAEECLILASSSEQYRAIYFENPTDASRWHRSILERQGFLKEPIKQYKMLHEIASGTFGTVLLCEHVFSRMKFVIKIVDKV